MSLFRLVLTFLWVVSLGVFLVFVEAERVRMQHALKRWEALREDAQELEAAAAFYFWASFEKAVPADPLLDHLTTEQEENTTDVELSETQ